jgi:hypothetical protein
MLKREDLPLGCNCPVCFDLSRLQNLTPNSVVVSAMQDINDSIELYDSYIAPYKCPKGHIFYISYQKS